MAAKASGSPAPPAKRTSLTVAQFHSDFRVPCAGGSDYHLERPGYRLEFENEIVSIPELERLAHSMSNPPALKPLAASPRIREPNQPVHREWNPAPRVLAAVPRAELVSIPVRRATLVEN